ncbi:hypothetical protein MSP8886_00202 [Marinomonas spartinae]|uniref:THAP4-like heme-binding beta-barrel domain-containing protein n=1 Tax=Marinomonas spartinae TaxID=1792290 RepID=A0A1A8T376_9GAMM|nr:heme-binding protein [Marinomonas spartinae]SBS25198.1 hypothetical protein MSP8886_00202 [Marinomonas spartinae]
MSINDHLKGASRCPFHQTETPQNGVNQSASPFVPDYNIPLLAPGGGDNDAEQLAKLGPLRKLIGTWVSNRFSGYNVMPIPQATASNGFIVKNFYYYEVVTFSAILGKVANRGGVEEQDSYTIFYEQRVFFAEGEQRDKLVHAENGSWSHFIKGPQGQGILNTKPNIPSPPAPNPILPQNPDTSVLKQISVPHGNSILALGGCRIIDGAPTIENENALPINTPSEFNAVYGPNIPENPNVNPNIVLQKALSNITPHNPIVQTHVIEVNSDNNGEVSNVPFIREHADVSKYTNTIWIEELASGFLQLQYSQNITLSFPALSTKKNEYLFPHVTANTLYKVC